MAPLPGPYSGTSTLALVARTSAFTFGLVYGSMKLKYLTVFSILITIYWQRPSLTRRLKLRHITEREQYAVFAV
ncbi:hypothetical protein RND71_000079 [Anisodus tanguticus]|uniref:Uncharacterized protein n=1 Tax=Anisodus tanguticus TaxID=243964 RepID=A0AAE1VR11_9SOLA|nr:hypothetical protein RND71_000079 [Anisodus tanguticus]